MTTYIQERYSQIVNLTPHEVTLRVSLAEAGERVRVYTPSGQVARVSVEYSTHSHIGPIPLVSGSYGEVTGLPMPRPGVFFIVSALVRQAMPQRMDLLSPANLLRDDQGRIVGCAAFETNTTA